VHIKTLKCTPFGYAANLIIIIFHIMKIKQSQDEVWSIRLIASSLSNVKNDILLHIIGLVLQCRNELSWLKVKQCTLIGIVVPRFLKKLDSRSWLYLKL
jgi:hypothetical protein